MELRIEPYTELSLLPNICQCCLYWEHPRLFKTHPEIERAKSLKREWVGKRGGATAWGFVAYANDAPVGFCHCAAAPFFPMLREYHCGDASPDSLFIACLYIAPSVQGHGIGQRLRARVEEQANADGFTAVETIARRNCTNNPSGPVSFWQKNGYAISTYHDEFALMRKELL
ncbi:MAG TPA: GNAT family N-acetyltransferase [Armatimonadota bacterium]|jgi:GNAT superfamily N-acetyltransferase